MIFQQKYISVFLFELMVLQLSESLNLQSRNMTLFMFNHPSNCKRSEYYSLDSFSCFPCDTKANLQSSFDKITCECIPSSKPIANYDTSLHRPICAEPCINTKANKCRNITTSFTSKGTCSFKYVNHTADPTGVTKHIRIYLASSNTFNDCSCNSKYNYIYGDFCIWKDLLKNFLSYNSFWQRGSVYANLKFVAFFCQSLQNITACNHLANLCVQSFFNVDKNSPCSIFLLSQAMDTTLYSSVREESHRFQPFLFYKRGRETSIEMENRFNYSFSSNTHRLSERLNLFTTVYSLDGHLISWEQFRPKHVNLCGLNFEGFYGYFEYFNSFQIACELTMENIIDLASVYANKQYFSIFFNHTKEDNIIYMQTIPVLIENAFDGNAEPNVGEWQLVKRFQIIGALTAFNSIAPQILVYEDSYKLKLFKSIRILRKFELRCTITDDNKILIPLIVLNYHQIDITLNTSLNEMFKFELVVRFEEEQSSSMLYKICLPVFLIISLGFAVFRSYIFKRRRNLQCYDMTIVLHLFLHLMSNMGNSFLLTVIIDAVYSIFVFLACPNAMLKPPLRYFDVLIYSAIGLKGIYVAVKYWKIVQIDIFFVDWERPKGNDTSLHLKSNLETSSDCSSVRTLTENTVSAWRIFFVANEWIELSGKQRTSSFIQGLVSLTVYLIITTVYTLSQYNMTIELFICVTIFSIVHMIQRIFRNLILNQVLGSPLQKFMDVCTLANVSMFTLMDSSFGFYVHGRSPHGFSDTDMSSMILQLQRESQNMCSKRGLLNDSDFQTYIILPPLNLKIQIEKLLPLKQTSENLSHVHFQKHLGFIENNLEQTLEKSTMAYNRVNRFFCAFIDHAIKDMDYIIKEKSFIENLLSCEFESFLTENKGTFYIDNDLTFSCLFLYGNQNDIFVMELLLLIAINILTNSFVIAITIICISNKFKVFSENVSYWCEEQRCYENINK